MPRKFRTHYRFAFHHVMLRGNNRKNIFLKKADYQIFIDIISGASGVYNFKVHLFCLMTNHIHLVIEVGDVPISRIMQSVSTRYAKSHNKKYNKIGHLFQGRFKSKLISDDHYLIELCYYIHMNPVKAKICKKLDEYRWSSHHCYKARESTNWLKTEYINKVISDHYGEQINYLRFIKEYRESKSKPLFCKIGENGNLDIVNNVGSQIQNNPSIALENISLTIIAKIVSEKMNVSQEKIESGNQNRQVCLARSMIAYFSHYHAKYTFQDIAAVVCRQPNSISKTMHRYLKLATTNRNVRHVMATIERALSVSDVDRWVK